MSQEQDERIGRVMTALRTAEPPAGMEGRIVARLQSQAQADVRKAPVWGWALGVGMAALVLAGWMVSRSGPRVQRPMQARAVEAEPTWNRGSSEESAPQRLKPRRVARSGGAAKAVPLARRLDEEQGMVSYPAPEGPLTAEEKLLQRIARGGDDQDFALLNAETREQEIAAEKAEFESFLQSAGTEPADTEHDTRQNQ